ncbi:2Fe-2S iron-sulfur cluster-binding protein [Henriciella aquimarina]|uniref:2Fe-2S iron-sulfur cluster-binding protein n=1 Tax=Henriciella aquimarina TaxID=545261 RepID=UPI0009FFD43D|nr:2Fe-2S iron-sulfur cluster-binding protein [Henriciella aquimarina]
MVQITVTDRSGTTRSIEVEQGLSLMETLRENGFDEIQAICGGCCSCATCHVYVEEANADAIPPMDLDEEDLLDFAEHRTERSRLSCQIPVTDDLGQIRITIAPEE